MKQSKSKSNHIENVYEKQKVYKTLNIIDIDELNGNLEDIISIFEKQRNNKYENISIMSNLYGDKEVTGEILIGGYRLETDEEFNKRMELVAKMELNKVLAEKRKIQEEESLYLQLKKKYENKNKKIA